MKLNKRILIPTILLASAGLGSIFVFQSPQKKNLADEALLSLIKNDQAAFESYVQNGGDLQFKLPAIDGKSYTVAEGVVHFERASFLSYLQKEKKVFIQQDLSKDFDILSLSIKNNNPEILSLLMKEKADFSRSYGKSGWSLLHMASSACSHKLIGLLSEKIAWNRKAQDGSTPLTLAAERDCLPALSYWKEQGVDFKLKDGRGLSALDILRKKKDAALVAFAESFEPRKPAAVVIVKASTAVPDFYKKRKVPKDAVTRDSDLVEPGLRPEEANETSEYSEFSD